jgi:hypothetical protein
LCLALKVVILVRKFEVVVLIRLFKSETAKKYWGKLNTDKFLNLGMGKDGRSTFLKNVVNRRSYTLPKPND